MVAKTDKAGEFELAAVALRSIIDKQQTKTPDAVVVSCHSCTSGRGGALKEGRGGRVAQFEGCLQGVRPIGRVVGLWEGGGRQRAGGVSGKRRTCA